jgi:hypothetical protein
LRIKQHSIGDGEQHETSGEAPHLAEHDRVSLDSVQQVALAIARLVGQVASREGQREEATDLQAAATELNS